MLPLFFFNLLIQNQFIWLIQGHDLCRWEFVTSKGSDKVIKLPPSPSRWTSTTTWHWLVILFIYAINTPKNFYTLPTNLTVAKTSHSVGPKTVIAFTYCIGYFSWIASCRYVHFVVPRTQWHLVCRWVWPKIFYIYYGTVVLYWCFIDIPVLFMRTISWTMISPVEICLVTIAFS